MATNNVQFTRGNLLDAQVEALVNTVNTVGVMGKGIALMFKQHFPENYRAYVQGCRAGQVQVGEMFVVPGSELGNPKWIISFPTKKHWRQPSELSWVRDGLSALKRCICEKRIRSVAIPALGCGNGGLDWWVVRPLIEATFKDVDQVDVLVYEPESKDHFFQVAE